MADAIEKEGRSKETMPANLACPSSEDEMLAFGFVWACKIRRKEYAEKRREAEQCQRPRREKRRKMNPKKRAPVVKDVEESPTPKKKSCRIGEKAQLDM